MSASKLSNKKRLWIVAAAFALIAIGNLVGALGRTRGTGVWNLEIGGRSSWRFVPSASASRPIARRIECKGRAEPDLDNRTRR
jgi:hypothetical protein